MGAKLDAEFYWDATRSRKVLVYLQQATVTKHAARGGDPTAIALAETTFVFGGVHVGVGGSKMT